MSVSQQSQRYSVVAMALHWLTALCVIGLLIAGHVMTGFQDQLGLNLTFQIYQLHKSFGVLVFALTALRIFWRLTHPAPPLPDGMAGYEVILAKVSHIGFYVLLVVMPLTGWAVVSAATFKIPTFLFNVVQLPHLAFLESTADPKATEELTQLVHYILGWVMVALLGLHVAGALKHHFIVGDDVLRRMIPGRGSR